jgi:hypothetical protein
MNDAKTYTLLGLDGPHASPTKGELGGNRASMIYGRLDCSAAKNALGKGYERVRVFFADEATAIATGYRPCRTCMYEKYKLWKAGDPRWKEPAAG